MVLPRRPPSVVVRRPMRPEAPTLPVGAPQSLANGFFGEHEEYEDGEERTQRRPPPSLEPETIPFRQSRDDATLDQDEDDQAELLARVEQLARLDTTARMDRSGINEIVRQPEEDRTRVGAPRPLPSRAVAIPTPLPPPPHMHSPALAYAQTQVQMHMLPPAVAVHTPAHVHAPNVIPGYVVAHVPAPPPTARKTAAPKKSGPRVATFLCGMVAVGMAIVALAESPIGYRPEVAPYARIVRTEARSAAVKVRHGVLDLVARVQAP